MSWTDERIDKLTRMWEGGSTASQIAEELGGVSRNAVIGKAHRLGLKARPSPVKANERDEDAAPAPKPVRAAPVPPPVASTPAPAPVEAPAPRAAAPAPRAAPIAPAAPVAAAPISDAPAPVAPPQPRIVSVGPGGFLRQGPGEQQAPIWCQPSRALKLRPRLACWISMTASAAGRWGIRASLISISAVKR